MIRKATIKDVKSVHALLQEYGNRGELLSRPLSELYDHDSKGDHKGCKVSACADFTSFMVAFRIMIVSPSVFSFFLKKCHNPPG